MESILLEALEGVSNHEDDYGDPSDTFADIASGWSVILGQPVSAHEVGLMMIWLKIAREMGHSKRDNLVDIAGYAECLSRLRSSETDGETHE